MNKNKLLVKNSGDTSELRRALSDADKSLEEFGETAKDVSNYVNGWSAQMAKWGLAFNAVEKGWNILKAGISIFTEMGDSLKRISERTGAAALTTQLAGRGSCSASKSAYGT